MGAMEYFSKDFEWEELKAEVKNDFVFRFHIRHSSGKFFK
jgi:hypothetical protein